ncbi:MAG TPA: VCBS repeat-containing protein, partial [Thermoanaerobaculia bacterium]|nr:VCBS repeat-containing protein [Thermoanaerobaculia bacterium]
PLAGEGPGVRALSLCALAIFLIGATPPPPPPPPAVGVTLVPLSGARRTDAVLPGHLLGVALPKAADGRRQIVVLTTPDDPKAEGTPKGPRSLYLIDPERAGAPRRLLEGLPAEANALAAADLDGDGTEEILLGEPGKLHALGTPEAPASRLLLETAGLDLRRSSLQEGPLQVPTVGRLRTWTFDGGRPVAGPEHELPVRASRERQALRLSSLPVTSIQGFLAVGPEEHGKLRLRTILIGADGKRTEAWSQLPGREDILGYRYVTLEGRPALIVTTTDAEKMGVFAHHRFRLFPLTADRSRSGQAPSLAFETESNRWFSVDPVITDLDRDGKEDLVVIQPEGMAGGDLVIDTFFGQGNGRFERPRRLKLSNLESRSWSFGRDVTGDGVADLVTLGKTGLGIFAGTADPRRDLLDRKPRQTVEIGAARETVTVSVGVGTEGVETGSTRSANLGSPHLEDLDGNGRPEVLLFSRNANGRGRVTVVRLGG